MLSRFELRRFRGLLPVVALIFAMLVPVIYGAVYLAANWDPYSRLDNLPVALVNEDKPTSYDGEQVSAGKDIADELLRGHTFDWRTTNLADAEDGLQDGHYYLLLHIPSNFSANLVSAAGNDPKRAELTLRRNDANGFVIGSVTGQAQSQIERAVDQAAVDAYFKAVFKNLGTIRSGMADAAKGSAQVTDGLKAAKTGSGQLATGLAAAKGGSGKLAAGASTLNGKMPELTKGAQDLNSGLDQLASGSSKLAIGASRVADGTQQLYDTVVPALDSIGAAQAGIVTNVTAVNDSVQALNKQVNDDTASFGADLEAIDQQLVQLGKDIPAVAGTKAYHDVMNRLGRAQARNQLIATTSQNAATTSARITKDVAAIDLAGKSKEARSKLSALNSGAHQVATGAASLHDGLLAADQGSAKLSTGVGQVSLAVGQISQGATELDAGVGKLSTGAGSLDGGLAKLVDGSSKLTTGLDAAVKKIPALSRSQADSSASVLSQPANVKSIIENPAKVYGRGLAPLFFSIAMWVFGISGFLVMRPISGRMLAGRIHPLRLTVAAWLPFGAVALAGAGLMLAATWVFLGLDPVHGALLVGLVALTATVFSGIAHLFRTALGLPGSALLLVWLILQLSSTGGTYPAEVLPAFFQWLHPLMPITYTIDAFRMVISGGLLSRFWSDVAVLVAIGAVTLLLDVLAVAARQRFRMADLHPPLSH